jgi:hypothetical protein
MTWADLRHWGWDPSLRVIDQHPIAHALGGLVFVALAAFDLLCLRRHAIATLAAALTAQGTLALPIVRTENQNRPLVLSLVAEPLALVLSLATMAAFVLPWVWKPWALATGAQASWELAQRAAWWDRLLGRSTYPVYSAVLDAGTASAVAALVTLLWRLIP